MFPVAAAKPRVRAWCDFGHPPCKSQVAKRRFLCFGKLVGPSAPFRSDALDGGARVGVLYYHLFKPLDHFFEIFKPPIHRTVLLRH